MDIDWWLLIREARLEAWKSVGAIFNKLWSRLIEMITSGETLQASLALLVLLSVAILSGRIIIKLLLRIIRYDTFSI